MFVADTGVEIYRLSGVELRIPSRVLSPRMRIAFSSGKYEALEARYLSRILKDGDRLLELGGGVGFISALAGKTKRIDACCVVEANPELCSIIEETHRINGLTVDVRNGAAFAEFGVEKETSFYLRDNFWGSSLSSTGGFRAEVKIPKLDFQHLIDTFKPSIIICDIEGGEVDLFPGIDLSTVDRVYFELHKSMTGQKAIGRLFRSLIAQGLIYDTDSSVGSVVLFSREI